MTSATLYPTTFDSMLNIITRPPYSFSATTGKYLAKSVLEKFGRVRGPASVLASLQRGLNELEIPYLINQPFTSDQTVHVPQNIKALEYAIEAKRLGKIRKLIAGPNLVVFPTDHHEIIASPHIDAFLTVSDWTQKLYADVLPSLADHLYIWPAGVEIPEAKERQRTSNQLTCVLFIKHAPQELSSYIQRTLTEQSINVVILAYGTFSQKDYFSALEKADFLVYVQEVESQGLALQEAWARNVPTLVWNKGSFTYPSSGYTVHGNIAAPFLTDMCGMLFGGEDDFLPTFAEFLQKLPQFNAREYCIEQLSDKASVSLYATILRNVNALS